MAAKKKAKKQVDSFAKIRKDYDLEIQHLRGWCKILSEKLQALTERVNLGP